VDGMDGVLLLGVMGAGTLVGPVGWAVRRPNPTGPGRRCRTTLGGAQVLLDETLGAWCRRGRDVPVLLVGAREGVQ